MVVIYVRFLIFILNLQINIEKQQKMKIIHNLKAIEISMKMRKQNTLTISSVKYPYMKNYKS